MFVKKKNHLLSGPALQPPGTNGGYCSNWQAKLTLPNPSAKYTFMRVTELGHGSKTVVFALEVLEVISEKGEAGLTEIAVALKAQKSRVVRVLRSLFLQSYVAQNEQTKKYRIGSRVSALAESHRQKQPPRSDDATFPQASERSLWWNGDPSYSGET